jgi:hypothetical protein
VHKRELIRWAAGAAVLVLAGGCASLSQLSAEVSSFGEWPAGRAPGRYAFERLPSQQSQPEAVQQLEDAAAPALERAGFLPVAPGAQPDVLVQVGARVSRSERSPWDDPLWWPGGFGMWHHRPWHGAMWSGSMWGEPLRYDREVAVLIRDRASGKPLFEARASVESFQGSSTTLLQPLFAAALADFPALGPNPRRVVVPLSP